MIQPPSFSLSLTVEGLCTFFVPTTSYCIYQALAEWLCDYFDQLAYHTGTFWETVRMMVKILRPNGVSFPFALISDLRYNDASSIVLVMFKIFKDLIFSATIYLRTFRVSITTSRRWWESGATTRKTCRLSLNYASSFHLICFFDDGQGCVHPYFLFTLLY